MKIRSIAAATLAGAAALAFLAPTATAEDTDATFTVTGGFLTISVPSDGGGATPVNLGTTNEGSLVSGADISGQLGDTTVDDERNSTTAGWEVSANASDFVKVGDATKTVAAENVHIFIDGLANVSSQLLNGDIQTTLFVPDAEGAYGDGDLAGSNGDPIGAAPAAGIDAIVDDIIAGLGLGELLPTANNSVTYDPTVEINIPADTSEGTYLGTIEQTVA